METKEPASSDGPKVAYQKVWPTNNKQGFVDEKGPPQGKGHRVDYFKSWSTNSLPDFIDKKQPIKGYGSKFIYQKVWPTDSQIQKLDGKKFTSGYSSKHIYQHVSSTTSKYQKADYAWPSGSNLGYQKVWTPTSKDQNADYAWPVGSKLGYQKVWTPTSKSQVSDPKTRSCSDGSKLTFTQVWPSNSKVKQMNLIDPTRETRSRQLWQTNSVKRVMGNRLPISDFMSPTAYHEIRLNNSSSGLRDHLLTTGVYSSSDLRDHLLTTGAYKSQRAYQKLWSTSRIQDVTEHKSEKSYAPQRAYPKYWSATSLSDTKVFSPSTSGFDANRYHNTFWNYVSSSESSNHKQRIECYKQQIEERRFLHASCQPDCCVECESEQDAWKSEFVEIHLKNRRLAQLDDAGYDCSCCAVVTLSSGEGVMHAAEGWGSPCSCDDDYWTFHVDQGHCSDLMYEYF